MLYQEFLTCLEVLEFSFWALLGVKGQTSSKLYKEKFKAIHRKTGIK